MRPSLPSSFAKIILICCLTILAASGALAQVNGAIFTTIPLDGSGNPLVPLDGSVSPSSFDVNANVQYPSKPYVFLNGGPQGNGNNAGLSPTGAYYFQVTDPSGQVLLSADDPSCRIVDVVPDLGGNGRVDGLDASVLDVNHGGTCPVRLSFVDPTLGSPTQPVQLCPPAPGNNGSTTDPSNWCDNTPNNGGEYKAWLTPFSDYVGPNGVCPSGHGNNVFGFCDKDSKTDNFKVRVQGTPPCDPNTDPDCQTPPPSAQVTACKFQDQNNDGMPDNGEPLLPGWSITATNADGNGGPVTQVTDNSVSSFGCTTFNIGFANGSSATTITLTETLQPGWTQTAPLASNTFPVGDGLGGTINVTTDGNKVESLTVVPGDNVLAPDFGNSGLDLVVTKTAVPTFTRTYSWTIQKTNDKTSPIEQSGGTVTVHYTVTTGFTLADSNYAVSGKITVKNPNVFAVVANVTDAVDDGGSCTVTDGTNVNIPAANYSDPQNPVLGSVTLDYSCSYSSAPSPLTGGTNTATASWDNTVYFTPGNSASGTAGVDFTTPTTVLGNPQNVYDAFNGGSQVLLGVDDATTANICTANTNAATDGGLTITCTAGVFKYSRTISVTPGLCVKYDNTAAIADQTANSSVTVCGTNTGALTMGFWQNKNGQGIIASYCGGTSGVSLHTFLNGYNPFKDETSTTCSGEASYVLNIIKNAVCTSSTKTCNLMLRAQMLATALDVYFSTPNLGGNKIGPFNGLGGNTPALGGVKVDLQHICAMVDSSSGASCTGITEDVRSEFGIASPCIGETVNDMLGYSNFSSLVNGNPIATATTGAIWYNQNKGRQVPAKDAFDNINNQIAKIAASNVCSPSF